MLCDGDTFYTADIVSMYRAVSATHNATFTFCDTQPKPIYSYVTTAGPDSHDVVSPCSTQNAKAVGRASPYHPLFEN